MPKKATDEQIVSAYERLHNVHKVAELFSMCGQSVQERLVKLGIERLGRGRPWTKADDALVIAEYANYRSAGNVAALAKRMGRNYFTLATRAKRLGVSGDNTGDKLYARKIKGEAHARKIFDQFKRSGLGLLQFSAKTGWDDELLRKYIREAWPDEWDAVIESKAPRQTKYRLGRAFEYHTRDLFRKFGYFVLRSPRSGSPVDLVAVKRGSIVFIQCKRSGAIVSTEWNALFDLSVSVGATPILAERPTGRGIVLWEMVGRKDGSKKSQPRKLFTA